MLPSDGLIPSFGPALQRGFHHKKHTKWYVPHNTIRACIIFYSNGSFRLCSHFLFYLNWFNLMMRKGVPNLISLSWLGLWFDWFDILLSFAHPYKNWWSTQTQSPNLRLHTQTLAKKSQTRWVWNNVALFWYEVRNWWSMPAVGFNSTLPIAKASCFKRRRNAGREWGECQNVCLSSFGEQMHFTFCKE